MGNKYNTIISVILIVLVSISLISATTGSIGNARMILRVTQGDNIEKSILVKNVNDVPIDIEIHVSGDLANDIELKEDSFRLKAGEDRQAFFTIKVRNGGTTESKINIAFRPEEGNSVGLSATIIVIAEENNNGFFSFGSNTEKIGQDSEDVGSNALNIDSKNIFGLLLLLTTTGLLAFVVLLSVYSKHRGKSKPKKRVLKQ